MFKNGNQLPTEISPEPNSKMPLKFSQIRQLAATQSQFGPSDVVNGLNNSTMSYNSTAILDEQSYVYQAEMKKLMVISQQSKAGHTTSIRYSSNQGGPNHNNGFNEYKLNGLTSLQAEKALNYAAKKMIMMKDVLIREKMASHIQKETAALRRKKNEQLVQRQRFQVSTNPNTSVRIDEPSPTPNPFSA